MGNVSAIRWRGATLWKPASAGSLVALCLLLSSPASASAASIDLPAGTSTAEAGALEVSSYQDAFGVSKQTAEENLEAQSDGAAIAEQLQASQGERYAGVWFDNESGEFVVPTPPDSGRAAVAAVLSGAELEGDFRTKAVQSSWEELEAAQRRIDDALGALIEAGLVGTGLDPKTNAVVIEEAAGASAVQRAEVQAAAASESVKVEVRQSQGQGPGFTTQACQVQAAICDAPMRGGVNIVPKGGLRGMGCTAGFKATGNANGNRFMLTAGHCVAESGALNWDSFTTAQLETREPLGHVDAYSFPTHDYAAINVNGTNWDKTSPWPTIIAYWGINQEYPITSESSSYLGEYVCHLGEQSGLSCGAVTGMHLTEPVEDEAGNLLGYVYNLTRFEHICAIGGDSGGPVFAGNIALGLYTGSDKPKKATEHCYYNGYYTEITEDTDLLGVHVAPRVAPPSTWHTDNLGGIVASDSDIASWGANRLDVFTRGTNNVLCHKSWDPTYGWSAWEQIPGGPTLTSGPGAVSWGPGRIDVVARVADGSIGHWGYESGVWGYENLGGNIVGDPDISSWQSGRLDIFARGTDDGLFHKSWTGGWSAWEKIYAGTNLTSGPGAVSWGPGRIDVVARVAGNTVGHWSWGGAWSFENLGGNITADPDISSWESNRVDIFARGTDNGLYHRSWTGGWSAWEGIPGPALASGPGAVSWGPGRIDVVGKAADGSVSHWYWSP
jgi:hypothetical protein